MQKILCFDPAIKNLAWAIVAKGDETLINVIEYGKINLKKDSDNIFDNLINILQTYFNDKVYDIVIIESQPMMNITSKSVQMILYTFFKLKHKKIIFQHAKVKNYSKKFEKKNKYAQTKKFSVECAKAILDDDVFLKIKKLKKIDDICDCINHSVAYLYKNNLPDVIMSLV